MSKVRVLSNLKGEREGREKASGKKKIVSSGKIKGLLEEQKGDKEVWNNVMQLQVVFFHLPQGHKILQRRFRRVEFFWEVLLLGR